MTPERWQRVKELFEQVAEREPADQPALLQKACGDDATLRLEVESLLAEEGRASDFMKDPVTGAYEPLSGKVILHYKVMEKLGEGGMGVVYKARDSRLDRFVALKVLPLGMMADPERKRRFAQEARAASALNHPNIITIHDIAHENCIDLIVMEYVPGKTLGDLIGGKGLPLRGSKLRRSNGGCSGDSPFRWDHTQGPQTIEHHGYRKRVGESAGFRTGQTGGPK